MGPNFLNLDYFFNLIFAFIRAIPGFLIALMSYFQGSTFRVLSTVVSALLLTGVFYLLYRIALLEREKIVIYEKAIVESGEVEQGSEKWEGIMKKLDSENSSDWKVAIIEADSLIDLILQKSGHEGKDLGERLKGIEPSDFSNLSNVWEAHKLRNRIAHEPGMDLQKRTAQMALSRFEAALKELRYL